MRWLTQARLLIGTLVLAVLLVGSVVLFGAARSAAHQALLNDSANASRWLAAMVGAGFLLVADAVLVVVAAFLFVVRWRSDRLAGWVKQEIRMGVGAEVGSGMEAERSGAAPSSESDRA